MADRKAGFRHRDDRDTGAADETKASARVPSLSFWSVRHGKDNTLREPAEREGLGRMLYSDLKSSAFWAKALKRTKEANCQSQRIRLFEPCGRETTHFFCLTLSKRILRSVTGTCLSACSGRY